MSAGGVGTVSGKMVMHTREWSKGCNSATMSLRTHGRKAKAIFNETRTAAERYEMKVAELGAMHKKSILDTDTYRRKLSGLRREYLMTSTAAGKFATALLPMSGAGVAGTLGAAGSGMVGGLVGGMAVMGAGRRAESVRRAMRSSMAIMGDLNDDIKRSMGAAASTAAGNTSFSTEETSRAFYYLASAGLDAQKSIAALDTVTKFAQAGEFDLSRATDLLTDAQMAMGMASAEAGQNMTNMVHVADTLVGANTLANASVEQFSESLTNTAGAALRLVNKDIEEGVAWLAVYANQGIKGADAGTALSIVLRDLQTKAIKNSAAFAEMKIGVYDNQGAMRNLADIIGDMERAMDGMSDKAEKATLLQLGLSDKSVAYTQALIGMSKAGRDFEEQLRSMSGVMEDVSGKQLTDFAKGWERVKAAWDSMATGPAGKAMDVVGQMLQGVSSGTVSGVVDAALAPSKAWYSGVWNAYQSLGSGWNEAADKTVGQQRQRGVALDKASREAYQRNLDTGRRNEDARALSAVVRGKTTAAMRATARQVGGGAWQIGQGLMHAGRIGAAELGFQGQLAWLQTLGGGAKMRAGVADTDAADKLRQPFIKDAMRLLSSPGASQSALQFPGAETYGSQAAASSIARAMAPGADTQKRTIENIYREMLEAERDRKVLMRDARIIADKMVVAQEVQVPARAP